MLCLADLFDKANAKDLIPLLGMAGSYAVAFAGIIAWTVIRVTKSVSRERSRREIAAYVAEGSLSPEEAERMMNAGNGRRSA